jgi:hypothetical protein
MSWKAFSLETSVSEQYFYFGQFEMTSDGTVYALVMESGETPSTRILVFRDINEFRAAVGQPSVAASTLPATGGSLEVELAVFVLGLGVCLMAVSRRRRFTVR